MKMVIADDEMFIVSTIRRMTDWQALGLEDAGAASNGNELLECIVRQHPDIVLTDICMPGMDGLEVISRTLETGFMPRFIILSAYATFDYARQAMHLGVDDFLTKPINRAELNRTLQKSMAKVGVENTQEQAGSHIIKTACMYIETHFDAPLQVNDVAQTVYLSPNYFCHLFKAQTGLRFTEYLAKVRMMHALTWLAQPEYSIDQIAAMCGYEDAKYFSRVFKQINGLSPQAWRKKPSASD